MRGIAVVGVEGWLRQELRRRKWKQADLARRMNASTGAVSQWVNGIRVPLPESCERLADVLGADVDYVLALAGHRPTGRDDEADPERAALIASLLRAELTPERAAELRALFAAWARSPVEGCAPPVEQP